MPSLRAPVALLAAVALVAACSGSSGDPSSTTTSTAGSPETTSTSAPTVDTTATTVTGTTQPDACGVGPRPPAAVAVSQVVGDFDGDGTPDALLTYGLGTAASPPPWHLRLEPATGNAVDIELPNPIAPVPVQTLGGYDLSGDGRPEAFVVVGGGTSLLLVGVFELGLCTLVRVPGPDGQPSVLPVEAEANHRRGIRCDGARVFTKTADSDDGVSFRTGEGKLQLSGDALIPAGAPTLGALTSPADDAAIAQFSTIECGDVMTPAAPTG